MKKASVVLFVFFCLLSIPCFSQGSETEYDQLDVSVYREDEPKEIAADKNKRLDTNLEIGTSFTYSPKNFYGPSYYIAPSLSYLVTPRFSLTTGLGFEYTSIYPLYGGYEQDNAMLPMTRAFLYARGSYLLTERLMVTGTVYKSINDVPKLSRYSHPMNYNYQAVDMGIQYQINRNFSVGFHMRMNHVNYPSSGLIPPDALVPVPGF